MPRITESIGVVNVAIPYVLGASSMVGDKVVSNQDEDLGNIVQVMLDLENESVAYVVLSLGNSPEVGGKLIGVPLEALRKKSDEHTFVLKADKDQLKNAPTIDNNNWPGTHTDDHRDYIKNIHSHYGYE